MQQDKVNCAIYTRVSTDSQAEVEFNSCESQELKIKSFISSQENMVVYKHYSDPGFTGAHIDRPALQEMLRDIEDGKINIVVAYKIDRLTRSPKDFYQLVEIFDKYSASFISVTERFDTSTPSGRLLRNIMLTFAQFERELVGERVKDKMFERAKKGLFGGGPTPYGYKRIDKKLVVNEEEAKIIKEIFNTYIKTKSLFKTYEIIKRKGIIKRNNKIFTKGDIYDTLRKPVYNGKIVFKEKIYQGIHKPIISDLQFEQAKSIFQERPKSKWRSDKKYLFPGIVVCKECGSVMTPTFAVKVIKNRRKRYFYYRCTCTYKKEWNTCTIRQISAERLDSFITKSLERVASDPQYLESLSFTLNYKSQGTNDRFEPGNNSSVFNAKNLKSLLDRVVKISLTSEKVDKGGMMKKHIKNIIYSKEQIELKLYKTNDFLPLLDQKLYEKPKLTANFAARQAATKFTNEIAAAANFLGKSTVCKKIKTGGGRIRTSELIRGLIYSQKRLTTSLPLRIN